MTYKIRSQELIDEHTKLLDSGISLLKLFEREDSRQAYLRNRGRVDMQFFFDFHFLHWQFHLGKRIHSGDIHQKIDEAYRTEEDINVIIARGHAKTTRILVNAMHDMLYKPGTDLGYLASSGLGDISIGRIRVEMETNPSLKWIFGSLCPKDDNTSKVAKLKRWRQSYLELLNGSSIESFTRGASTRGRRKHKIIVDDPQEDKDCKTKEQCDAFNRYVFTTVYNMMLPGGCMIALGTIVSQMCFVVYLRDKLGWKTLEYKAIENGKPVRPEMRSLEELEKRKAKIGTANFNQEFMNIPLKKDGSIVMLERCKRYFKLPILFDQVVLTIDPAVKTKQINDFTGIVLLGIIGDKRYVIRSIKVKLSPLKNIEYIHNLYLKAKEVYGCSKIIKEDNIEVGITEELLSRGLPIVGIVKTNDKRSALLNVSPDIENGNVYFRDENEKENDEELIYQITNFPDVEHDDLMDALVIGLEYARSRRADAVFASLNDDDD